MPRKTAPHPLNALLRYRSSLVPERIVEMDVFANDPSETTGDIKILGKDKLKIRVDTKRNVWWVSHRPDARYPNSDGNYDRLCGTRAELLPLPEDLPLEYVTGIDPNDYNPQER